MEIDILNMLIPIISSNAKTVKKVTRAYQHLYPDKTTLPDIKDQITAVISKKTETELTDILADSFSPVMSYVKAGVSFQEFFTKRKLNPSSVISNFVLYKTCELLLDKWKEPDVFEKKLFGLMYHNVKKTKEPIVERSLSPTYNSMLSATPLLFGLGGSYELFAMLHDLFLRNDISFEDFGKISFSSKECREVSYEVAALLHTNHKQKEELLNLYERLLLNVKGFSSESSKQELQQGYFAVCIAVLVKLFIKFFKQKLQEAEKAVTAKPTVIVKEDTATKALLEKKQEALNKLQIKYDKQQQKLETLQEELDSVNDYVNFIEQAQSFIEKVQEEDGLRKPVIPEGKGVVLFGGHPNYQNKISQQYPWVQIVDPNKSKVDRNVLINARYILINWKHLPHQQFYAIMPIIRKYKKEIVYVW